MASAHGLKPSTVDESDVTADRHRNNALDTHRYLRGGMVVLIVTLGAAVLGQRLASTCWQTSISAYYHTAAHNVFIAAICGIGVLMIVYHGSSNTENVLLTVAGLLAFVVAMVPINRRARLAPVVTTCW
jgi:hypothetical protein